jgi:hypothetical protein
MDDTPIGCWSRRGYYIPNGSMYSRRNTVYPLSIRLSIEDISELTIIARQKGEEIPQVLREIFMVGLDKFTKKPTVDVLEKEKLSFLGMEDKLMGKYKGKFVAIFGGTVVDSDKDDKVLVERIIKKYGGGTPILVQKVGERIYVEGPSPDFKDG